MEKILKKQTKEQILNDFKKLKELNYNLEKYVPSFYEDTINLFQEDIKELERLSSSEKGKSIFVNKLTYKKENISTPEEFRKFVLKNTSTNPDIEFDKGYFTYQRYLDGDYESYKTSLGGMCFTTHFCDNETNKKLVQSKVVFGNAYRNPFDTIQTIFHEFCHAMQSNYDNKTELIKNLGDKICTRGIYTDSNIEEYNQDMKDFYLNDSYIVETEADLFGCLLPLVKSLAINNKEVINDTIKQIEDFLFKQNTIKPFDGYFSYPIIKDYLHNEEKLNELREFIEEDNKIDILKLRNFTKELTLNKQQEYYEDLFKDTEIDGSIFDKFYAKSVNREENIEKFLEQHKESKFVKDYVEFRDKCKNHELDENTLLEERVTNLQQNIIRMRRFPHKYEYFKEQFNEKVNNLQNALDDFESKEKKKVIGKQ